MCDEGHLNATARAALALPAAARLARIRSPRWIGYTRAKALLAKLDDLLTRPKTHRMPNLLIVGNTNAGKTMLAQRFVQVHRADDNPDGEAAIVPVLAIQAPPTPEEGRFYNTILEVLGAPYNPRERVAQKQVQVLRLLKQVGLRMLSIDEVQNVITGPVTKQRQFLNVPSIWGTTCRSRSSAWAPKRHCGRSRLIHSWPTASSRPHCHAGGWIRSSRGCWPALSGHCLSGKRRG
jgi:hypothetical protein